MGKWLSKCARGTLRSSKTLGLAAALSVLGNYAAAACSASSLDLRWEGGSARFTVEIADDNEERARGLMFRASMPQFASMLFVYDSPRPVAFWMRNTEIPLDMLFFDETGETKRIHENAIPFDETAIEGGDDIQYILEINGGMAKQLGMKEPIEIRHPSISQADAAWPCN